MVYTANSGVSEHPIPEKTEHMIPKMAEHLKPEHKHHNVNAKQLYNSITNRLLTLNRNKVLTNTRICSLGKKPISLNGRTGTKQSSIVSGRTAFSEYI